MSATNRTVMCVKLHKELPGLTEPPFNNDLGQKIYDQVSQAFAVFLPVR